MSTKILMVCLGNICRSPLAEGILRSKVNPEKVFVDSAGTGGYHIGSKPDSRSIAVARKYDIDITNQRCRQFQREDFEKFDIIYAMDKSNYSNIIAKAKNQKDLEKVRLILKEVDIETVEVPDPYYEAQDGFERVFQLLDTACDAIVEKLRLNK